MPEPTEEELERLDLAVKRMEFGGAYQERKEDLKIVLEAANKIVTGEFKYDYSIC